jgi:hypothetical protein
MLKESQAYQARYIRALELVEMALVSPNGSDGCYYVHSQTRNDAVYTAKSLRVTDDQPVCDCADDEGRRELGVCKHIIAAGIFEKAEPYTRAVRERLGLSWDQMETRLLRQLCLPHKKLMSLRLGVLLTTVRRLAWQDRLEDHKPEEIGLVVQYRTSGGRYAPHCDEGTLLEVIEDGQRRDAKTGDMNVVYAWLMANGYEPVDRTWLDPAGYLRRRKATYRRESA